MKEKCWYAVAMLFRCIVAEDVSDEHLWEVSVRLFRADSDEDARRKAEARSKDFAFSYSNVDGEEVRWIFERVLVVQSLDESRIEEGTEVFSWLDRACDQPNPFPRTPED